MKKITLASLALAGALTLSGCAVTYPADEAPTAPVASESAETPTPTAPDTSVPAGSPDHPLTVASDGTSVIDATPTGGEVFVTASANSSFEVVAGDLPIEYHEASRGVLVEQTERGVRVTVLDDTEGEYVIAYDSDGIEHWIYLNEGAF